MQANPENRFGYPGTLPPVVEAVAENEGSPNVDIPDPLEEVIEGETRSERYQAFTNEVLGQIWNHGNGSGEYGDDFWRPLRHDRGDISGYSQFQPTGVDLLTLSPDHFNIAVSNLRTPDYLRVRSVPSQITLAEVPIIPVGGSCAIETWGMRTTTEMRCAANSGLISPEALEVTSRRMLEMAPTISHISGAVLSGQPATVHLIEDEMWAERVASYGLPPAEARELVGQAYLRINEAVTRRALLINPQAQVIPVNFDELNLPAAIKDWLSQLGTPYHPDHRILEVIHTYVGPTQLELLKNAIQTQLLSGKLDHHQSAAAASFLEAQYHMRGKQIDHGRWGSMIIPNDVIVGERQLTAEELQRLESDYSFATALKIMSEVHHEHTNNGARSLVTLFADLPSYNSQVQHQDRNLGISFSGKPGDEGYMTSVEASLKNYRRLHRGNVEEHLNWLRSFCLDNTSQRTSLIENKKGLVSELSPLKRTLAAIQSEESSCTSRISRLNVQIDQDSKQLSLCQYLQKPNSAEPTDEIKNSANVMHNRISAILQAVIFRQQNEPDNLTVQDRQDLEKLPQLLLLLAQVQQGEIPELSPVAQRLVLEYEQTTRNNLQSLNNDLIKPNDRLGELALQEAELLQQIRPLAEQDWSISTQITKLNSPDFPLQNNPFVHHAMQFLWDPDFVRFLSKAVIIQEKVLTNRNQKNEARAQMRELYQAIYPKLEAYIRYLYGLRNYPVVERERNYLN